MKREVMAAIKQALKQKAPGTSTVTVMLPDEHEIATQTFKVEETTVVLICGRDADL